ncbi:hypothetical protein NPIL_331991 [Nephila pilipes]|uniref:Uncharacterized protein n=1 Tax=Nephila pilipes TaxID=299642 RepID=A0A8X6QZB4_NEPPI|nr:hypothetical protein NPIL_331991 [Nephila pilipes]
MGTLRKLMISLFYIESSYRQCFLLAHCPQNQWAPQRSFGCDGSLRAQKIVQTPQFDLTHNDSVVFFFSSVLDSTLSWWPEIACQATWTRLEIWMRVKPLRVWHALELFEEKKYSIKKKA